MPPVEIDPIHIAATLKEIRREMRLTQANVADLSGLTPRTIEKVESGKHRPSEYTLRSLARGLKVSASIFVKPNGEEVQRPERLMADALKRNAIVRMSAIDTPQAFHGAYGSQCAILFDLQHAKTEPALDLGCELQDWLVDYGDVWDELSASERWCAAKSFTDYVERLAALSLRCFMGEFSQIERAPGLRPMVWTILVVTLQPVEVDLKVVLVPLRDNCEVRNDARQDLGVESDRAVHNPH
jgi:transcriptional regulator with XRE-family HTH domain